MSEGPKVAAMTVKNGDVLEFDLPTPGRVRIEFHGGRTRAVCKTPLDATVTRPVVDFRNADDLES